MVECKDFFSFEWSKSEQSRMEISESDVEGSFKKNYSDWNELCVEFHNILKWANEWRVCVSGFFFVFAWMSDYGHKQISGIRVYAITHKSYLADVTFVKIAKSMHFSGISIKNPLQINEFDGTPILWKGFDDSITHLHDIAIKFDYIPYDALLISSATTTIDTHMRWI